MRPSAVALSGVTRRRLLQQAQRAARLAPPFFLFGMPGFASTASRSDKALIAITMDLEMSRDYPQRGMTHWDYEKGNLDEPTKQYALHAARIVKQYGGVIHFFLVGRVLEQADVGWLHQLIEAGHPIGNHTYDHVNVMAGTAAEVQYRFQRAPWLIRNKSVAEVIRENIEMTTQAMRQRLGIEPNGFRAPGGFAGGLRERSDLRELVKSLGFRWCSSLYPSHPTTTPGSPPDEQLWKSLPRAWQEAQPFVYSDGLLEIPMSPVSDVTAFRSQRWKLAWFLESVRHAVDWAIQNRAVFDFLCHPSCLVVEDPQGEVFHTIGRMVTDAGDKAALVSLDDVAKQAWPRQP
ncbi:MAG: hypothetical protein KatS3mg110_4328 [Pirellulaceae bacterium]|nr:MAG: hypothetical protein KatS3mg110_4328 [Pirellulaceae bacterium]